MVVMRDVGIRVDDLVRWDGQHLAHVVHTTADLLRQRLVMIMISVMGMAVSLIDTRIDGFLLGGRNDLVRCRGLWVFGVSIVRGDREHLAQMVDAVADSLGNSFLVVLSGGHDCFVFQLRQLLLYGAKRDQTSESG